MIEHLQNVYLPTIQLLWPALLCAGLLLLAGAMVGTFVLLRRESLLALTVPQAVVFGSALALRIGLPPILTSTASVAALLACLGMGRRREIAAMLLPAIYVGAMASAVMLVTGSAQDMIEVQNQFVGIDVAIDAPTAIGTSIGLLISGGLAATLWRRWLLISQLPETAALARSRPTLWHLFLLILLAVVAISGTATSGLVLTIAALFLPGTIGLSLARRLPVALAASAVTGMVMLSVGFVISVELEAPLAYSIAATGFAGVITAGLVRLATGLLRTTLSSCP